MVGCGHIADVLRMPKTPGQTYWVMVRKAKNLMTPKVCDPRLSGKLMHREG